MTDQVDCVVVGAGVVGLAVSRRLALDGHEVLIVERNTAWGSETSARSSEVIHAGLYYPPGSLKSRLCLRGRRLLYDYCSDRGIPHRRCGKLVLARERQLAALQELAERGRANGVDDLRLLDAAEVRELEPRLRCGAALLSPSTGIVDSHALMLALLGEAEDHGAALALSSTVGALRPDGAGVALFLDGETAPLLRARWVINAAGLGAAALAGAVEGFPPQWLPRLRYAKGSYFRLAGRSPFSRLIYPLPEPGGLGVHLTLDLAGQARFGPDVEWVDTPEYHVDAGRAAAFAAAVQTWWPELEEGRLVPAYAGVRPKLHGPGEPAADFRIDGPAAHGVPGLVNLFGIESPGLTASLAIAERVAAIVAEA